MGSFQPSRIARAVFVLVLLVAVTRLTFQPDPHDVLRKADALFAAGRYHEAFHAYRALATHAPDFALARLRLAMTLVVRGEGPAASREFGWALKLGLNDAAMMLARLYQGRMAADMGYADEAARIWAQIPSSSALYGLRLALEAEERLRRDDYTGAEAGYHAALAAGLPESWRWSAYARIAALRAGYDPTGAWENLRRATAAMHNPIPVEQSLTAPLRPSPIPDPAQIAAILVSDEAIRPQLLGQVYLTAGWLPLAEAQFALARNQASLTRSAEAYAAYARISSGDYTVAIAHLRNLVATVPDDPRPRTVLALAYLAAQDASAAFAEIREARRLAPDDPDVLLALGEWYAAQRDYVAAAAAYAEALRLAPPGRRGAYALMQAQYHLRTSLQVCDQGLPAAAEAVAWLPGDAQAWSVLAQTRLACGDAAGSRDAAAQASRLNPASPEAAYHYGRALAALGDRAAARDALIRAADLAPASEWRVRAETQIAVWGLP
jgi:tetratricopeptide (TPR) repeat protein